MLTTVTDAVCHLIYGLAPRHLESGSINLSRLTKLRPQSLQLTYGPVTASLLILKVTLGYRLLNCTQA